ncbi:MAG: hypothetical protein GY757_30830 [bacterium]|nr:hypothetical protein [bacterium]
MADDDYAIQAHRNSYKTTSILVVGVIWYLLFQDPEETILIIRKEKTGAAAILKEIKQHYESKELKLLYRVVHGKKEIKTKNWSNSSISLSTKKKASKEGNVEAVGIGGAVTGRHYGKVFADDIITLKDRVYRAEREKTKEFVRELSNIPKTGGNVVVMGTPWHKEDAWSIITKAIKYPLGSIKIRGFTEKLKAKLLRMLGESLFAANYELQHKADKNKEFSEPKYCPWPEEFEPIAWLDPAYDGSNTTALSLLIPIFEEPPEDLTRDELEEFEPEIIQVVARGWVWREDISELYDEISELLFRYNVEVHYIEKNADKGLSAKEFRKRFPNSIALHESANKHIKIKSFVKGNWDIIYFADDCQPKYMNQIMDYSKGEEPDDAIDSLGSGLRQIGLEDQIRATIAG